MKLPKRPVECGLIAFNMAYHSVILASRRGQVDVEAVRRIFSAAVMVLEGYRLSANFDGAGTPREQIPLVVVEFLIGEIDSLRRGRRSAMAELIKEPGGGTLSADASEAIYFAIVYLKAVELCWVTDQAPVKTVTDAFEVSRSAVHGWRKKFLWAKPLENRRELIKADMLSAAERYRAISRSAAAITTRAKKKHKSSAAGSTTKRIG